MEQLATVEIVHRLGNVGGHLNADRPRKVQFLVFQDLPEMTSGNELGHDVNAGGVATKTHELHDVGVADGFQNLHLPVDQLLNDKVVRLKHFLDCHRSSTIRSSVL